MRTRQIHGDPAFWRSTSNRKHILDVSCSKVGTAQVLSVRVVKPWRSRMSKTWKRFELQPGFVRTSALADFPAKRQAEGGVSISS